MRFVRFGAGFLAAACLVCVGPAVAHANVNVLFVGNSLSWGVRAQVVNIVQGQGVPVTSDVAIEPGITLAEHLHRNETLSALGSRAWDYVVLQEQSAGIYGSRVTDMKQWIALVRGIGAEPILYMTYRDDAGMPANFNLLFGDPRCLQACTGYMPVAQQMTRVEARVSVAPVGKLFDVMRNNGIALDVFGRDGHHLNGKGKFLVAATISGIILDAPVTDFPIPTAWNTPSTRQAVTALAKIMGDRLLYNYDGR